MPVKSKEGGAPPSLQPGDARRRADALTPSLPRSSATPSAGQGPATPRLHYREFRLEDRAELLTFVHDPGQLRYMLFDLSTERAVDEFLTYAQSQRTASPRSEWHWAVELAGHSGVIGGVSLMVEPEAPLSAELGYWFRQDCWGRGYATEACQYALEFGFLTLDLHRVWGKCHVDNTASARVMEKLGMVREGLIREHVWLRDHYRSSYQFSLLDREFRVAIEAL